jgi:hypothetical protein
MTKLLLSALVIALVIPTAFAQAPAQDQVVLRMEISKNGSVVAQPALRMRIGGGKASLAIDNGPSLTVELVRHDGVIEAICEFRFADGTKPTLRMKLGQEPASAKIVAGKDTFDIKMDLRPVK